MSPDTEGFKPRYPLRPEVMAASYPVEWSVLSGPANCAGCLGRIETGRRALKFGRGNRELRRLEGQWFHTFDCLARRAQDDAAAEADTDAWRSEPFYELERWARARARERRMVP
jgi:hypothetical protein